MNHCVAQYMLKAGDNAVQHATVDFQCATFDVQAHAVSDLLCRLTNHCIESVRDLIECNQPHGQDTVLQFPALPVL